ncbi:sulfatase [Phycisphaeraceae bacterium D3-23]
MKTITHLFALLSALLLPALAACSGGPRPADTTLPVSLQPSNDIAQTQDAPPPNIVIIFTDDQGYGDLSCFGHPTIHTPHLDALAADGMKLTQCYVASPVCSPSRAALLTGCYPKRVGMHQHVVFPMTAYGLDTDETTIADMLRQHGYATGCFGKWHLGHRPGLMPTDQGFDTYYGVPYSNDMSAVHRRPGHNYQFLLPLMRNNEVLEWEPDQRYLTRDCTQEAVAFIEENKDEPFFVYLPHSMPHIPLYASEDFEGTSPRGLYGDVIEEIDWSVGQIVATLEEHGLTDNTLIFFTSDNGPWLPFKLDGGSAGLLRGGKGSNWEGGQRVPAIIALPGTIPPGSVCREVVTTMDLLPTIAAMTGATLSDRRIDGHDVTPLLTGDPNATSPTDAFLYYTSHGELAGIRRGPWKLLLENGQLFHLDHDPSEQYNLANNNANRVAELRALAAAMDAEITEHARPRLVVEELLFDPKKPE